MGPKDQYLAYLTKARWQSGLMREQPKDNEVNCLLTRQLFNFLPSWPSAVCSQSWVPTGATQWERDQTGGSLPNVLRSRHRHGSHLFHPPASGETPPGGHSQVHMRLGNIAYPWLGRVPRHLKYIEWMDNNKEFSGLAGKHFSSLWSRTVNAAERLGK